MSATTILNILLIIVAADFVLERVLSYLNSRSAKQAIPDELAGVYDEEQYSKSQAYRKDTGRFELLTSSISFVVLLVALGLGWFGDLDAFVRSFGPSELVTTLIFFAALYVVIDVLSMPFSLYATFVIEEKYGFNKTTWKTFITDKLKGYLLSILIGGLLLVAMLYLIEAMGEGFWLYFWIVITAFTLFMNMFYASWILPLFNKLEPLESGELKEKIEAFSSKVNFPLRNIFVMDGSKRSSKGNAFFSGLGRRKKVVLFDTLIQKHDVEELTAVFAHEVGHYKKRHIITSTVLSIVQTGVTLFLLSRMLFNAEVSAAMGGQVSAIHLNILAFGILYTPLSRVLGIFMNILSRKFEYEADAYAAEQYKAQPLISALKKMSSDHLSNLTPHPAFVFVHYSHPPLLQRVKAMNRP